MALFVEIVTPERSFFSGTVKEITLPAYLGEMNILPGHVPYLVVMEAGALMLRTEDKVQYYAIDRGFAQIKGDHVSIMTELIVAMEDIDLEQAKQRRDEALAQLQRMQASEKTYDPDKLSEIESTIRFGMAQQVTRSRVR